MSDKGRQDEESKGSQKKLRKEEKRLRERLQEAQQEQDNALERLRRAEARLRKRVERVQRLESRLNIVDQQMRALNAPLSTIVTLIPTVAESGTGREAASEEDAPIHTSTAEMPEPSAPSQKPSYSTEAVDTSKIASDAEDEVGSVSSSQAQPPLVDDIFGADLAPDEMLAGETEPQFLEQLAAGNETPAEVEKGPDEEAEASENLNSAVLHAREARAVAEAAEEAARDAIERAEGVAGYLEQIGSARHLMQELEQLEDEAAQAAVYARETEEAAQAAERAASEGEDSESDGDIKLTAEEEHIIASIPSEEEREVTSSEEPSDADLLDTQMPLVEEIPAGQSVANGGELSDNRETAGLTDAQAGGVHTYTQPTQLEVAQVEEIDEEGEELETVAAMIIADAAAIAAAEAEALAEASSSRTREARNTARETDRALDTIRQAVRNGVLVGDEANSALEVAERDATHAHAALADAEAAEERARTTAMNAEAEAEVAEGMAFSSGERNERDEKLRDEYGPILPVPTQEPASTATKTDELEDDEDGREDTQKLPRLRPEQS